MTPLGQIADVAGWSLDQLIVLDRQPVSFLFIDESGERVVVRNAETRELRELELDDHGRPWDIARARARNRKRADAYRGTVSPELIEILIRHAKLDSIAVIVTTAKLPDRDPATQDDHERVERQLSGREILSVAADPAMTRIELGAEPIIND